MSSVMLAGLASLAAAEIRYTLAPDPVAKSVRVSLSLELPAGETTFRIPAWCPGFYTLRNYQDKIFDVRIRNQAGNEFQLDSSVKRAWTLRNAAKDSYTLSYRVLGDDPGLGFFGVNVKDRSAFVNGPAAFMHVEGRLAEKCSLKVTLPSGWDVATAMEKSEDVFSASNYDEFIDHPIELGTFKRKTFEVNGIPFEAVFTSLTGRYPDLDAPVAELRSLAKPAIGIFGSAPFKKYLFIVHLAVGDFNGGLEHRASNVIAMLPSNALEMGTLAAHEYFHAWNVKQIRPKALGPFDYTRQVRTANLWFSEGVTDYYAYLTYFNAGLMSEESLLLNLGSQIDDLQSGRTRRTKTLEETCRETWESTGFSVGDMSYYTHGLVCGLLFDAAIRDATDGERSLDDVMRKLFDKCRLPKPGFEEDELRTTINEVAGKDLSALYNHMIRSTQELPYSVLPKIGLEVLAPSDGSSLNLEAPSLEAAIFSRSDSDFAYRLRRLPAAGDRARRLFEGWLRRSREDLVQSFGDNRRVQVR